MEVPLSRRRHTSEELAEARLTVTSFNALVRDNGPDEAEELCDAAYKMLQADRAARINASWTLHFSQRDAA